MNFLNYFHMIETLTKPDISNTFIILEMKTNTEVNLLAKIAFPPLFFLSPEELGLISDKIIQPVSESLGILFSLIFVGIPALLLFCMTMLFPLFLLSLVPIGFWGSIYLSVKWVVSHLIVSNAVCST